VRAIAEQYASDKKDIALGISFPKTGRAIAINELVNNRTLPNEF